MKKSILLSLLLLLCINCDVQQKPFPDFVSHLEHEQIIETWQLDDFHLDVEGILDDASDDFTGFIYMLNSSCSVCIAQLLVFTDMMEKYNCAGDVIALIDEGKQVLLEHYLSQKSEKFSKRIHVIENKSQRYLTARIENEDVNGILVPCHASVPSGCFLYSLHID